MGASLRHDISKFNSRFVPGHLDSTTIVEASRSLSLRGTSGERAGERGTFHRIGAANWNPLSLTLSPLLCRGERESTSGMVVVLDAPVCPGSVAGRRSGEGSHPLVSNAQRNNREPPRNNFEP